MPCVPPIAEFESKQCAVPEVPKLPELGMSSTASPLVAAGLGGVPKWLCTDFGAWGTAVEISFSSLCLK